MDQGFMGCPWREGAQYVDVGLEELPAALYAFGDGDLFLQAEDGIRDLTVTGVQTCALPIWTPTWTAHPWSRSPGRSARTSCIRKLTSSWISSACSSRSPSGTHGCSGSTRCPRSSARSEERRVGKEGRSRWSPYH